MLVMKNQSKIYLTDSAMSRITAGINSDLYTGYSIWNALWYHGNDVGATGCEIFVCKVVPTYRQYGPLVRFVNIMTLYTRYHSLILLSIICRNDGPIHWWFYSPARLRVYRTIWSLTTRYNIPGFQNRHDLYYWETRSHTHNCIVMTFQSLNMTKKLIFCFLVSFTQTQWISSEEWNNNTKYSPCAVSIRM
jgi:hypothetical protein